METLELIAMLFLPVLIGVQMVYAILFVGIGLEQGVHVIISPIIFTRFSFVVTIVIGGYKKRGRKVLIPNEIKMYIS